MLPTPLLLVAARPGVFLNHIEVRFGLWHCKVQQKLLSHTAKRVLSKTPNSLHTADVCVQFCHAAHVIFVGLRRRFCQRRSAKQLSGPYKAAIVLSDPVWFSRGQVQRSLMFANAESSVSTLSKLYRRTIQASQNSAQQANIRTQLNTRLGLLSKYNYAISEHQATRN